ncbi:sulfatase-like hydrolase/transferase [Chloroflexi bacterium TSY]|nr:sulfatase-like hydrolase/transferase [Chloroflexi bacterium TSY]
MDFCLCIKSVNLILNHPEHAHANPNQPWFLCASFSRPHFPLTAPKRYLDMYWPTGVTEPKVPPAGDAYEHPMSVSMRKGFRVDRISHDEMMKARAGYFACISYLDEVIGDLLLRLESANLLENTIIVYTTDHGEMAGEHGTWWKNGWYEACTHIPMMISLPSQRSGDQPAQRVDTPVRLIDLFPTFCGLSDITAPDKLDGVDLSNVLTGVAQAPEQPVFCDNLIRRWGAGTEFRMVRYGSYKYVRFRDCDPLFFDLENDPGEQQNLGQTATGNAKTMLEQLKHVAEQSIDFDATEREREAWSERLMRQFPSTFEKTFGNQYLMPSGKLVEADDTLYDPVILAEQPDKVYADWPSG